MKGAVEMVMGKWKKKRKKKAAGEEENLPLKFMTRNWWKEKLKKLKTNGKSEWNNWKMKK